MFTNHPLGIFYRPCHNKVCNRSAFQFGGFNQKRFLPRLNPGFQTLPNRFARFCLHIASYFSLGLVYGKLPYLSSLGSWPLRLRLRGPRNRQRMAKIPFGHPSALRPPRPFSPCRHSHSLSSPGVLVRFVHKRLACKGLTFARPQKQRARLPSCNAGCAGVYESAEVSFRPRAGVARASSAGRVRPDLGRSPSPQDGLTAALPRLPPKSAAAWAGQGIGTNLLHR
jgi:hypothetical protein